MRNILLICLSASYLSSCSVYEKGYQMIFEPRPWGLGETPNGSPTFKQGWEDGCDSGLGAYGGPGYRVNKYRFKQDITQLDNAEYYRAWKDAYTYCRWYVWNWARPTRK